MNPLEKRLLAGAATLAIGWGVACGQPSTRSNEFVFYSAFSINVAKTDSHPAFEVHNAILQPPKGGVGGPEKSTIKFCTPENPDVEIEVPVSETDYMDKLRAQKEEKARYTAKPGPNPCQLVLENGTILKVLAFRK